MKLLALSILILGLGFIVAGGGIAIASFLDWRTERLRRRPSLTPKMQKDYEVAEEILRRTVERGVTSASRTALPYRIDEAKR